MLAFNDVSTTQARGKEFTMYQLMSTNVDGILSNYKMKAYPQEKVLINMSYHITYLTDVLKLLSNSYSSI